MQHTSIKYICFLVVLLAIPVTSQATLISYNGSGTITGNNGIVHNIYAEMTISSKIQYWAKGPGKEISLLPGQTLPTTEIQFRIQNFSLSIENVDVFNGNEGFLYGSSFGSFGFFFDQWNLSGDKFSFDSDLWGGDKFYNNDGSIFDIYDVNSPHYAQLAPVIDFGGGNLNYSFGQGNNEGEIDLVMNQATPVPEPATLLLFGVGTLGLIGSRLRKKYVKD